MAISRNKLKKQAIIPFLVIICISILSISCNNGGVNPVTSESEVYSAVTDDNVELRLIRYRPAPDGQFNANRQPILLLGGIFMNNDEFTPHTTERMKDVYAEMTLPDDIAAWAIGDEYIENDHMLYYNLGYYLWKQGFDPWFGNYRGTGRGEMKSDSVTDVSTLDVPGCLDMPAMVKKVTEVTGLKPFIGGHSTGALTCYVYLQGAYIDANEAINGRNAPTPYIPHVKVSSELAQQRNNSVRGFIGIDPAVAPPLPEFIDTFLIWSIIDLPIVLPLDTMMETMLIESGSDDMTMTEMMDYIFNGLDNLAIMYPDSVFQYLQFFKTANVDPYVLDFFIRYATSNGYLRMIAQYADWGLNLAMREGFNNGPENTGKVMPKSREEGDGYYYYEDHMGNITTPMICLLSEANGLVASELVSKYLVDLKTPHAKDLIYEIPGTAHADLPLGYTAPTVMFPMMSEWMNQF